MARYRLLTDAQWAKTEPLLPKPKRSCKGGHKPIAHRRVLEGILWVLRTGARWKDLPAEFPSPSTCWRRLKQGEEEDVWLGVWPERRHRIDGWKQSALPTTGGQAFEPLPT